MSRWLWIALLGLGLGASLTGCASMGKDKEEGDEVKITLGQCPPAVQATLQREAGGNKIDSVDQVTKDGVVTYEIDVVLNGQNTEIVVAADGKLLSKKADTEKEEKEEKGK